LALRSAAIFFSFLTRCSSFFLAFCSFFFSSLAAFLAAFSAFFFSFCSFFFCCLAAFSAFCFSFLASNGLFTQGGVECVSCDEHGLGFECLPKYQYKIHLLSAAFLLASANFFVATSNLSSAVDNVFFALSPLLSTFDNVAAFTLKSLEAVASALLAATNAFSASANCNLSDATVLDRTLIKFSFSALVLRLALANLSFASTRDFFRSAVFLTAFSVADFDLL
jgi:hypothetical protein